MADLPSSTPRIAVLGGGITGLTAAWHLQCAGYIPTVYEKAPRVGGSIGAVQQDGWLHELGPNSLLENTSATSDFIMALGLGDRRLYASVAAKKRYIVRSGKLVTMPDSPLSFATTKLFSWRAKLGLLGEPWRPRRAEASDESVAAFVLRRLGREFLDYAVNPFVAGVYAGDPAQLSVAHGFPKLRALEQEHGSLLRGAIRRRNTSGGPAGRMFSFPNGLREMTEAIVHRLENPVRVGTHVDAVRWIDDRWVVESRHGDERGTAAFHAVVCALSADALAELALAGPGGALRLETLREIAHPPVASIFTGYRRADVGHPLDGFGALMPQVERGSILGTLFSSTLFAGRAPEGHVALTTFVGGSRHPEFAALEDRQLLALVQGDLARLVGVKADPVYVDVKRWPRAIPQYTLGYGRFKQAIAVAEGNAPGLFIGGNCRDGISLPNCLASGHRLAECVTKYLPS